MERYEVLDHTADLMIKGYGSDLEECYANLAYGMFDQTVDLRDVTPSETREVDVTGFDDEDALYSFLSELLFIEAYENIVLKEFDVKIDGLHITCTARGELLDRSKMRIRGEIKAVTFHMMDIDRDTPSVTVLFDV
ncbi:MAG: archease [Candidatus Methanomethylophilus sp.]|jgi:SHS2 domain-containing protein|nr:archease [Methanomethylophilus sp.]MBQ4411456.1 archease [Methanomethylophilus sp.]MBQ5482972.1 archease [Methanomethylophilus sp.]